MLLHLKCGRVSLVDRFEYEYQGETINLLAHRWYLVGKLNQRHVGTKYRNSFLMLHRVIVDCPGGSYVDHINRDVLDNRECNLRVCTNQQNIRNMRSKGGSSQYKGVSRTYSGKFVARIMVDGKDVRRKTVADEIEAAILYDSWAEELFGEFAWLNRNHFSELNGVCLDRLRTQESST